MSRPRKASNLRYLRNTAQAMLLLVGDLSSHGGIERFNRLLVAGCAEYARRTGTRLHVISLKAVAPAIFAEHTDAVIRSADGNHLRFIVLAASWCARHRPKVLFLAHVNFGPLGFILRFLRLADRYVVQLYGREVWTILPWHRRHALRRASAISSISHHTTSMARQYNGAVQPFVRHLFPVLHDSWLAVADDASTMGANGDRRIGAVILLTIARLSADEPGKGIDDVIAAMESNDLRSRNVRYVVIGDGTDLPRLRARAAASGVADRLEFLGAVSDSELHLCFRSCDIFVMPSVQEGFGIVYLEAMAYGKPIVAANCGGTPEVVIDEETGLLVEPGRPDAVTCALSRLVDDRQLRDRLGRAGRQRFEANFTPAEFSIRLRRLLDELFERDRY